MNNIHKNHIRTRSGIVLNPLDVKPDDILFSDIVWALSHIPRFGGHLSVFYSVAQHSIDVMLRVYNKGVRDRQILRTALMHDASEAYLLDMPSPIKSQLRDYKLAEQRLMDTLKSKYNLCDMVDVIKEADKEALAYEWDTMMVEDAEPLTVTNEEIQRAFYEAAHNLF